MEIHQTNVESSASIIVTELNWHGYTALGEFLSHHRIAFLLLYYIEITLWSGNLKLPCFQAEISNRK